MTLFSAIADKITGLLPACAGPEHPSDKLTSIPDMSTSNFTLMLNANGKRQRIEEDSYSPSKHRKPVYSLPEQDPSYSSDSASMADDEEDGSISEYDAEQDDLESEDDEVKASDSDSDEDMADEVANSEDEEDQTEAVVGDSDQAMVNYELGSQLEDDDQADDGPPNDETEDEQSTADTSMSSISNLSEIIDNLELEAAKLPRRHVAAPPSNEDMSITLATRRAEGWDEAHLALLALILARGQQAIMPICFQRALNYMPENLFTPGEQTAILESRTTPLYHSERHLTKILDLGGYMRTDGASMPEKQVNRYLSPYLRWASKDAGPRAAGVPPVAKLFLSSKDADIAALEARIARSMQHLAAQHSELLSGIFTADNQTIGPPTLYGIVSIGLKIVLLAYNAELGLGLHTVATFTFDEPAHDVWNSIALALILCHTRDVQISIGEAVGGRPKEMDAASDYDPDA